MSTRSAVEATLSWTRAFLPYCIALACTLHGVPVRAQERADTQRYRQLIADALQDFDRGNWEEAGALFAQAHALNPNARTLRGMGLAAFEARHYAKSLRHLRAALEEKRFALTSDQRKTVEQAIERAEKYVGRIRFRLEPAETALKIDGEAIELDAQGELVADPGLLDVEASAPGFDTQLRRVQVNSGEAEEVAIKLVSEDAEVAEPSASPIRASAPPPAAPTDSGERTPAIRTLKWVTGGLAAAALATGSVALILGESEANKWNRCLDDTVEGCADHHDAAKTDRTIGVIGLAAGGAFAITSVVLFVLDARSESSQSGLRTCGPGAGDIGMQCRVAF